jgi:transcriptional regulator with XRE-family HTH domain
MPQRHDIEIPARLRSLREAQGPTQQSLAERCGLSQATIWNLESGRNGLHAATLFKLAKGLKVSLAALGITWKPPMLDEEGEPEETDSLPFRHLAPPLPYELPSVSQLVEPAVLAANMVYDAQQCARSPRRGNR